MKLLVIIPTVFLCTALALPVIDPTDLRLSVRFDAEPARFFERESVELLRRAPPGSSSDPRRRPPLSVRQAQAAMLDNPPAPPPRQDHNAGPIVQGQPYAHYSAQPYAQYSGQYAQHSVQPYAQYGGQPQMHPAPAPYMVPPPMIPPQQHLNQPGPHFPPQNAPAHYNGQPMPGIPPQHQPPYPPDPRLAPQNIGQPPMMHSMIPPQQRPYAPQQGPYAPVPRMVPQSAYNSRPTIPGMNSRRNVPAPPAPDIPPTPPPPAKLPPTASPPVKRNNSLPEISAKRRG